MATPDPVTPKPIFVRARDLPSDYITAHEMCSKCEAVSGKDTIEGAQSVNGLWRVFCKTPEARLGLLMAGFSVRGHVIALSDTNTYQTVTSDGCLETTTRLVISDLPMHMPVLLILGLRVHISSICVSTPDPRTESTHLWYMCGYVWS